MTLDPVGTGYDRATVQWAPEGLLCYHNEGPYQDRPLLVWCWISSSA